jgi:tetratricopeptide (TPR) repeat protein
MRSNSFFLLWFGLLLPFWLTGQEANDLLRKGKQAILSDQLDSAAVFYQQAFQTTDPDSKIRALGGLIRTAILNSELDRADSLVGLGDQLLKQIPHKENTLWEFQLAKGEYFRKSSQFDRALKQHQEVARAAASDKTAQLTRAYALFYTALTFERTATYDSSLVYIDRAYDLFRQELDTTDLRFSEIYNGLGVCYYRSARYDESKIFYLESKRLAEQHLGPVSTDLAIALNNLSSISRANENYREAIDYSEQALSIYRALDDKSGQSGVFYSIGVYYYFLGDYGRTKDYMEACIAIRKQLFPPDHYSLIGPYEVLGIAYEESGDYEKTLQYLEKVRPIIRSNYGEASLLEGFNMENTALCFRSMDQLDSALLYIQRANAIIPQHFSNIDYSLATHHFSYAYISYLRGDYSTAKAMIQGSSEILSQLGMASSSEYAQNRVLEALILTQLNQPEAANGIFQSAIQQIRQDESFQLSPNSLWILNHYTEYLYNLFVKTSDPKVLEDFQTYSGHYLDLSDRFRKQFNDPYTKSILIKDNAEVYNRNIGIYHRLYQKTRDPQYLEAGYRFSEYGRTSLLRDLQDEKIQSYAGIPDSVLITRKNAQKRTGSAQPPID